MRKKGLDVKKNIKKISAIIILILILSISIGYSALNKELTISNIAANIVVSGNIKVSSFDVFSSSTSESYSNSTNYEDDAIITNVHLRNDSSWVKYSVAISNLGNEEMGIANIIEAVLPDDLTYVIEDYSLQDMICDDTVTSKCSLGIIKTFYITIKYKNGISISTPTDYNVRLDFDFEPFYSVIYDSSVCTDCVSSTIGNAPFTVALNNTDNLDITMNGILLNPDQYSLNVSTKVLTINNVTGNISITKGGYTELFYIESTGSEAKQYINIGYVPKNNTTVIYNGMVVSGDTALFGSRDSASGGTRKFTLQCVQDYTYRSSFYGSNYSVPSDYAINTRYTFKQNSSAIYINNTLITPFNSADASRFNSTYPLYLFAVNTNNSASNFGSVRLYSMKIYEDETLVMDIIPVLNEDNVPGVYDKIGGDFYGMASGGTGEFNYAFKTTYNITNNITTVTSSNTETTINSTEDYITTLTPTAGNTLPKALLIHSNDNLLAFNIDYIYDSITGELTIYNISGNIVVEESIITQVPYLKSNGSQYVDTLYTPNVNTKVIFTFIPTKTSYTPWMTLFGCRNGDYNTDAFYASTGLSNKISTFSSFVGAVHVVNNITVNHTIGATEVIAMTAYNTTITVNGTVIISADSTEVPTFTAPNTLYIFGRNIGTGALNAGGTIKFVEMQIYENDVLIKDFIPAVNLANEGYIYEEIEEKIYPVLGGGMLSLD